MMGCVSPPTHKKQKTFMHPLIPHFLGKLKKNSNFVLKFTMISSTQNNSLAEYYIGILKNLNPYSKRDLISRLSQSMMENKRVPETWLQSLFGAYKTDETAEGIISGIRNSRVSNRNIETL